MNDMVSITCHIVYMTIVVFTNDFILTSTFKEILLKTSRIIVHDSQGGGQCT
jgi:hypothetical protein